MLLSVVISVKESLRKIASAGSRVQNPKSLTDPQSVKLAGVYHDNTLGGQSAFKAMLQLFLNNPV